MKKPPPQEIPDTCICGLDWHPRCKLHGEDSEDYKKWDRDVARDKGEGFRCRTLGETMTTKTGWLGPEEWETFSRLFEKREGTNYYDVREQAIMLLSTEMAEKVRENQKFGISDILSLIFYERNPPLSEKP